MECQVSGNPKVRCFRKRELSLWLIKDMFCVPEQRLVDQRNTVHRNGWMIEKKRRTIKEDVS